ncbi:MAG: hypothetical protein WDO18_08470 [Acidobacteriota bacterium]
MAFCAQCGSEVAGSFCPKCGAKQGAAESPSATPQPLASSSAPLDENIVCAGCYLLGPLTGVLFLVMDPYKRNSTVRFHAFQSILVFVGIYVVFFAVGAMAFMPGIGLVFSLVTLLYPIVTVGLWLMLMFRAYNKERWELPIVGPLARNLSEKPL